MRKHWKVWTLFAIAGVVVVAALGWVSALVVSVHRQALVEENIRLALWRRQATLDQGEQEVSSQ